MGPGEANPHTRPPCEHLHLPTSPAIFAPSHTRLTQSRAGGCQVRRSKPGAARGLKEEEEEVLRNRVLPFPPAARTLSLHGPCCLSASAAGDLRQGWHFLPAAEVHILAGHHQNKLHPALRQLRRNLSWLSPAWPELSLLPSFFQGSPPLLLATSGTLHAKGKFQIPQFPWISAG